jgi:hypothetical protein
MALLALRDAPLPQCVGLHATVYLAAFLGVSMNTIRTSIPTIAICAAVALPLLAAEKLGAKIGLWETTSTTNMNMGAATPQMPAVAPEMLANLPPAQRAQMEEVLALVSGKPTTNTARSCVTEKDLADGAFRQQSQQGLKCNYTVVSSTSRRQETNFQCTSASGAADGKLVVELVDPNQVKGTMQMKSPQASVEIKFDSKWVAADCGTTR